MQKRTTFSIHDFSVGMPTGELPCTMGIAVFCVMRFVVKTNLERLFKP